MAQVKFFRGVFGNYKSGNDHKDAIYFSTDTQELLLNGVAYGISKADAEKLNNTVTGVNYDEATHTVTVSYTGDKAASTFVLPVASSTVNGLMSATDKAAFDVLNGTVDVEGSVKKQVADALTSAKDYTDGLNTAMDSRVDALEALTGLGGAGTEEGKSLSEQVADNAAAIAEIQKDYLTSTDMSTLMGKTSDDDAKTIAALNDKINNVESAAKSYQIKAITENLGTNVKEAWGLFDEDGAQAGPTIKVYKDSALQSVELTEADAAGKAGQYMKFTYLTTEGENNIVYVDVSKFLTESEFANGLQVSGAGVVSVKVDATSENFLTVGEAGVKLAGVQNAIDTAVSGAKTTIDAYTVNGKAISTNPVLGAVDINYKDAEGENAAVTVKAAIAALETAVGTGGSVADQIKTAVEALDAEVTSTDGSKVTVKVTEVDGKITAVNVTESDIASAQGLEDVVTSLGETGTVGAKIKANTDAIAILNGTAETDGSVAKALADAKTYTDTEKAKTDAYTVQGKAISTNPTFNATEIKLGAYTSVENSINITANTTIADAIKALEDAWTWGEA